MAIIQKIINAIRFTISLVGMLTMIVGFLAMFVGFVGMLFGSQFMAGITLAGGFMAWAGSVMAEFFEPKTK